MKTTSGQGGYALRMPVDSQPRCGPVGSRIVGPQASAGLTHEP